MTQNKPRRANLRRWLQGAPDYVLDCFDEPNAGADRYTIMFGGEHIDANHHGEWCIPYLGLSNDPTSPHGVSQWGEMTQNEAARFRYARSHRRIAWSALPEHIRAHVIARATEGD